jgi:muramoyltetrapeptide carboxypeptidase LdcA involved in peptidoglycan recycling
MPSLFSRTEDAAIQDIGKILFGEEINYTIPAHPLNRGTEMTGETIGGNLSILYSITGALKLDLTLTVKYFSSKIWMNNCITSIE